MTNTERTKLIEALAALIITQMNKYYYACTHRPPSPGAVPRGFIGYDANDKRGRYGVIVYNRILTDIEQYNYELKELN